MAFVPDVQITDRPAIQPQAPPVRRPATEPIPIPQDPAMRAVKSQTIDPMNSLRQRVIAPNMVDGKITPMQIDIPQMAGVTPVSSQNIDVSHLNIGSIPGQGATPQQASAGQRLSFAISPMSVMQQAMAAFEAQLPQLNQDFADQSEQLVKGTAAMGRTGSGLFNRDTGFLSDRARNTREALLGNLSFDAAKTDAGNRLQADIVRNQLLGQQEDRFANTSIANMRSANDMSMHGSDLAARVAMANQNAGLQAALASGENALRAALANQAADLDVGRINAQLGMEGNMFNAGNDLTAQLQNIQNAMNQSQFGANFMANQQARQDMLANQSQRDILSQLELMGRFGFSGDPTQSMFQGGHGLVDLAGLYGNNAAATSGQVGQAGAVGADLLAQLFAGGGVQGSRTDPIYPGDPRWQNIPVGGMEGVAA